MHPVLSSYSIIVFFYMRYDLKHLYCIDITHVVVYNLKKKKNLPVKCRVTDDPPFLSAFMSQL